MRGLNPRLKSFNFLSSMMENKYMLFEMKEIIVIVQQSWKVAF